MKEKERKIEEKNRLLNLIKITNEIKTSLEYPRKDIELLVLYHSRLREGFFEEMVENLLGENLLTKLERYGENSTYWKNSKPFVYEQNAEAKSKRPSLAWLRSKVKRYESETVKQISAR